MDHYSYTWSGYTENLARFVTEILTKVKEMSDNEEIEELFNAAKETQLQKYGNYYLSQVYQLAFKNLDQILSSNSPQPKDLHSFLETYQFSDFEQDLKKWMINGH